MKIVILTSAVTTILGIIVLTIQKIVEHAYLIPINHQKETIKDIAISLIQFANYYANPGADSVLPIGSVSRNDIDAASKKTRELSSILIVETSNINCYKFWFRLGFIKISQKSALDAARKLMQLSNSYDNHNRGIENSGLADEIRSLLHIPII
jgi:hypothetical protein